MVIFAEDADLAERTMVAAARRHFAAHRAIFGRGRVARLDFCARRLARVEAVGRENEAAARMRVAVAV